MNLVKISALAEIISSVAIVITLVYLTVQTRQNTEALLGNSRGAAVAMDVQFLSTMIDHPNIGIYMGTEIVTAEQYQGAMATAQFLRIREFIFLQYQAGILDRETLESYNGITSIVLPPDSPARQFWNSVSRTMNPEFVAYTNSLLNDNSESVRAE